MDWKKILQDRRALAGLGVAAVLGAWVLVVRRSASTSASGSGSSGSTGTMPSVAGYDSTSGDIATSLGTYAVSQQAALDKWTQTLTDGLDGIVSRLPTTPTSPTDVVPTTGSPSTPPSAAPVAAQPVATVTPTTGNTGGTPTGTINRPTIGNTLGTMLTVGAGQNWNTIAKSTGQSLDVLRQLNGGQLGGLKAGTKVRVG